MRVTPLCFCVVLESQGPRKRRECHKAQDVARHLLEYHGTRERVVKAQNGSAAQCAERLEDRRDESWVLELDMSVLRTANSSQRRTAASSLVVSVMH